MDPYLIIFMKCTSFTKNIVINQVRRLISNCNVTDAITVKNPQKGTKIRTLKYLPMSVRSDILMHYFIFILIIKVICLLERKVRIVAAPRRHHFWILGAKYVKTSKCSPYQ